MQHIAMLISKDLNFDVARTRQVALQQQVIVIKCPTCFTSCAFEHSTQIVIGLHDVHAFAATTGIWFDHQRKTDSPGGLDESFCR